MKKKIILFLGIPLALLFGLGVISSTNSKVQSSEVQGVSTTEPTSIATATPLTSPSISPTITPTLKPIYTPTPAPTINQTNSDTNNTYYTNSDGNTVQSPTYYNSAPAGATAKCNDGTYSFSQHRSGTCSGHGGVAQWL